MDTELFLKEQKFGFKSELQHLSDEELVARFNKQVKCLGGNSIRKVFLSALREEILHRNFDSSIVINKCGFKLRHKVKLENQKLAYLN